MVPQLCLVWDATCPNTLTPSHVMLATSEAGAVADWAEDRKRLKYADVLATHHFVPMSIISCKLATFFTTTNISAAHSYFHQ